MPQEIQIDPPGLTVGTQSAFSFQGTAAAAAITLTQPAVAGKINFVTGIIISGGGATAASIITVTLASGGTTILSLNIAVPAGVTGGIIPIVISFDTPVAGLGANQNMVLTVPSFGAGNTNAAAFLQGFTQ
jgi:hypothetical protein